MTQTENTYDMAIQGRGYFRIQLPSGIDGYTRSGAFAVGPDGNLVTAEGYVVSPGITIPQDAIDISINAQGEIAATIDGQVAPQVVGQLVTSRNEFRFPANYLPPCPDGTH